jgi:peptidoglycan/LPS O-acetylase OafA/YrhL
MSQTKGSVKHIDLLDYGRGIAILAVLLFHCLGTTYGMWELPWDGWMRDFSVPVSYLCFLPLSFGYAGVAIFFVVSGFCIHLSFQQQSQKWSSFFIRRFFRIYPPYLAALIFGILLVISTSRPHFYNRDFVIQILTHIFLVFNYSPTTFGTFNGAFWSLAVEAQLYLLYPVLIFLTTKLGWRLTMIILGGCEILIRGADGITQTLDATNTVWGQISWLLAKSPFGFWFSWALGAFLADAFLKNQILPFLKISPMFCLWCAFMGYFFKPLFPFTFLLFALTTAAVLSQLLAGSKMEIQLPLITRPTLKKIGLWSYSLYLLHSPLLIIYSYIIIWYVPDQYRSHSVELLLLIVLCSTIILFSILWYKFFELGSIAVGKRVIQKFDSWNTEKFEPQQSQEKHYIGATGFGVIGVSIILLIALSCWLNDEFTPLVPEENNKIAWLLATNADPAKRNGARAVKLAQYACAETHYKIPQPLTTLGVAYAEVGRFDDAIAITQNSLALATQIGNEPLVEFDQKLLELYQNHQPYHEPK